MNKTLQRIRELSLALNNPHLTEDEKDAIEDEILDLEDELEDQDNDHYGHDRHENY